LNIDYLQVGNGRLGSLIANRVKKHLKGDIRFARIDPVRGLILPTNTRSQIKINRLVICISPSVRNPWCWRDLLFGLSAQVVNGEIEIGQLLMISSTRVYDGIERGIVTAETQPVAVSEKAEALLEAENTIRSLAKYHHIFRPSGLYGKSYQKYSQILKLSDSNKPFRFGVDEQQVADQVMLRIQQETSVCSIALLTDSCGYYKGQKKSFEQIEKYSVQGRVLKNSVIEYQA